MATQAEIITAVDRAYDYAASAIGLSGCCYGAPHWDGPFVDTPCGYYFFLTGLVAQLRFGRILEIGSHYGGSIFSMARAVEHCGMASAAEIVTIDCVDLNGDAFRANPLVRRMIGDCFDGDLASQVRLSFSAPIDLMFIDAVHDYET
ncbi:MAG TPA: class I SAM-dependent methyltransferase, partial [Pirellulales bacterium]